jgi:hypothetical protein
MYISSWLDIYLGVEGRLIQVSDPPWYSIQGKEEGTSLSRGDSIQGWTKIGLSFPPDLL